MGGVGVYVGGVASRSGRFRSDYLGYPVSEGGELSPPQHQFDTNALPKQRHHGVLIGVPWQGEHIEIAVCYYDSILPAADIVGLP